MSTVVDFLGRLHPLVVHLPVTFLATGGVIELIRLKAKSPFWASAALACFAAGSVTALAALGSGWILEEHSRHAPEEVQYIELHEGFAVATTVAALAALAAEFLWRNADAASRVWLRRVLAWVTLGLIAATGHLGALAVWGADWLW